MYTEEDFNDFWLGPDGQVWKLVGYCEHPTATFARVDDPSVRRGGAVGSPILRDFRRLAVQK